MGFETVGSVCYIFTFLTRIFVPAVKCLDVSGESAGGRSLEIAVIAGMLYLLVHRSNMYLDIAGGGGFIITLRTWIP